MATKKKAAPKAKAKTDFEKLIDQTFTDYPNIACLYVSFEKKAWKGSEALAIARFGEGKFKKIDNPNFKE